MQKKLCQFFVLIIVLSGINFCPINAAQVNYWELTPQSSLEMEENSLNIYSTMVLMSKRTGTHDEVLLHIRDSRDKSKFTQVLVKNNQKSDQLVPHSIGDEVVVVIDPIHPEKLTISSPESILDGISFDTPWTYTDESWIISSDVNPVSNACLTIKGVDYLIYAGELLKSDYLRKIDYFPGSYYDGVQAIHELRIDIQIKGQGAPHYIDYRKANVLLCNSQTCFYEKEEANLEIKDPILKDLRHWVTSDQIKILVNRYYPGFWWILNESRGEAIFIAKGHLIEITHDLWSFIE